MARRKHPKKSIAPAAKPHHLKHFPPHRDFSSLSIGDLLEAREEYHVHLSSLENVLATAIGRYRIHEDDWYATNPPDRPRTGRDERPALRHKRRDDKAAPPRTLSNSVVRSWSWPAVLVFVRKWESSRSLGDQAVPPRLYLPDGRLIPTCVILATPDESLPPPITKVTAASELLGGGYLCRRNAQGIDQYGTIGCLVRNEGTFYAMTNKHVAGAAGDVVFASVRGQMVRIGVAADARLTKRTLNSLFREWPGDRSFVNLDAGLVRIDDYNRWTSQVFGIGEIGDVFDANPSTITLDLIGSPMRAYGGASGVIEGEIQALFFRYQSLGGFDYVTDLLIGARRPGESDGDARGNGRAVKSKDPRRPHGPSVLTHPGDSGTLWFYDPPGDPPAGEKFDDPVSPPTVPERGVRARRLRPIAMQWGGERFQDPEGSAFALASFVSTVCRELDVDIVRDWSLGHDEYWGKLGHFAVGWKACDLLDGKLGKLMKANQRNIGFGDDKLGKGGSFQLGRGDFVPLADVPDYKWVHSSRSQEGIQHFADIDIHDIHGGPSMMEVCRKDPKKIAASVWQSYFAGFAAAGCGPEPGLLPFRVWQIWEDMVGFASKPDAGRFMAAAGVMAHYVGDASQPLHCSYLHHGQLPMLKISGRKYPVKHASDAYKTFHDSPAAQVHGIYEETMLEVDAPAALAGVNKILKTSFTAPKITNGWEAGRATFDVMSRAQKRLSPMTIIKADDPNQKPSQRATDLWNNTKVRGATLRSLADSTRVLATLWKTAWKVGGGDKTALSQLRTYDETEVANFYEASGFLPSLSIAQMVKSGRFEPPA